MSNFEIYLARAQGNHKAEIETSHFLNENFRNYMEKVFYMELTGVPSKTEEKPGTSGNPAVAVDNGQSNLKKFKETEEKIIDLKLTGMGDLSKSDKKIQIKVSFGKSTPEVFNIPNYEKKVFYIKNKEGKYEQAKDIKNETLNKMIQLSGNTSTLSSDDKIKVSLDKIEITSILNQYFIKLFGSSINKVSVSLIDMNEVEVNNKNIELKVSTFSDSPNNKNQVGGSVDNTENKNNEIYINVTKLS
jgi:hypothetical protein